MIMLQVEVQHTHITHTSMHAYMLSERCVLFVCEYVRSRQTDSETRLVDN